MRCLKRRLSDIVYRQMVDNAMAAAATGPGGHRGTSTDSSVTSSHPHAGSSEKSLPGPAKSQLRTPLRRRLDTEGSHDSALRGRSGRVKDVPLAEGVVVPQCRHQLGLGPLVPAPGGAV